MLGRGAFGLIRPGLRSAEGHYHYLERGNGPTATVYGTHTPL